LDGEGDGEGEAGLGFVMAVSGMGRAAPGFGGVRAAPARALLLSLPPRPGAVPGRCFTRPPHVPRTNQDPA
jgi:hypothetical protein